MSQCESVAAAFSSGETKFWNSPELVDTFLGFLDGQSTLILAQAHCKTFQILQSSIGWKKFLKRSCPQSENMDRNMDEKTLFELHKDKMKPVVALLNLVEDPEAEVPSLKVVDILHLLCENFTPDGPDSDHLDVSFSCSHKEHAVSPLGFLFLEHLEDLVGPTELTVEEIFASWISLEGDEQIDDEELWA